MIPNHHEFASFGTLLKAFRTRRSLTQQQLAVTLGMHRHTLSRWEQGDFLPASKGMVLELARHLHLDEQETRQLLEASLTALAPHWSVPLPRNPFFTGREEVLEALHAHLSTDQMVALTQSYALHGLGGIGKTQLALEYAYRHALEYSAVFWIEAETDETVVSSLLHIAEVLQLSEREVPDQQRMVAAVQRWLSSHSGWLLIWDNLEDLELLPRLLPAVRQGAILLTTRMQALGTRAVGMDVAPMAQEEGMLFVLRRAKVLSPEATDQQVQQFAAQLSGEYTAARQLVTTMGGLPLALDQAGAYIEETGCSLGEYAQHYEQQHAWLLNRRGALGGDHPHSVATTFRLAIEHVEREQDVAVDVLRVCAFVHAEAIPEEVFVEGAAFLGSTLASLAADSSRFDQAMTILRGLSLVQRHSETRTLSMHRLMQVVVRSQMNEQEQSTWLTRLSEVLNLLFPANTSETHSWERCERLLAHVLTVATAISDQARNQALAEVLCKAADYLHERARYAQAEHVYQQAICVGEHALGPEHPDLARPLVHLALLYHEQGKDSQAEAFGSRALHLSEQTQGRELAHCLITLAVMYTGQRKHEQAESLFQRALPLLEQELESLYPLLAHALHRLALLYWDQGKYVQAEPLLLRAIALLEQMEGPTSRQLSPPLNTLALLYWKQGKYGQAEPLCERALHLWEQTTDTAHPQIAHVLTGLAILYSEQGKYKQAEPLFQRALHIWEQIWGPEHPQVAVALLNLGEVSAEQGKDGQAEHLYLRALDIEKRIGDREHPRVAHPLNNLAHLYTKQGKYRQAESLFRRALHIWGPDHPHVATALNGLANLSFYQGNDEQAEVLFQQALSTREQHLGRDHPETAQTLHDLAMFRKFQGNVNEARSLAKRAFQIRSQSLGEAHPKTLASRTLLAQLREGQRTEQNGASCPSNVEDQPNHVTTQERAVLTAQALIDGSQSENDPLQEFLTACCELHPRAWSRSTDLWQAYQWWIETYQERYPLSRGAFITQLKRHGCRADRTMSARIWRGIAIVKKGP